VLQIGIYYLGGCPNGQTTVERVRKALKELNVVANVREVRVDTVFVPALIFRGSPTVLVNGVDVEPSARTSEWTGIYWRTYRDGEVIEGSPSVRLIRQAILDADGSLTKIAEE
jgi:hypothetical protein